MLKKISFKFVVISIVVAITIGTLGVSFAHALTPPVASDAAFGTAFTYQGQLQNNGAPANGNFDFQFILYDAAAGGSQVGPIMIKSAVAVTNGLFSVQLDFGSVFNNSQLFLDISVRPAGGGSYTPLAPRQALTPAPLAQYALNAQNAVVAQSAQSVAWSNITGKPAAVTRQIIIPASAMSYYSSAAIDPTNWGLSLSDSAGTVSFVIPEPTDWDTTQPFTVTLNFALPSPPATGGTVQWRLQAGGSKPNSTNANASTGWDSLDYWANVDATPLTYPAVSGGYFDLMKTQSWVAQYSSYYNTWYFGSSVTTANDFIGDTMWHFAFQRGRAVPNSESYTGNLIVVSAVITYVSK